MIVKLKPTVKNYLWGGYNLAANWNKSFCGEQKIAETWELSLNDGGQSVIDGGKYDGMRLCDVADMDDFGQNCLNFGRFPALVKLIDAAKPLSLQVHPNDAYALRAHNSLGKTEVWHVLSAQKDAFIYLGFARDVTKQEFLRSLQDKTLCSILNKVAVHAGDTYLVSAGTIHAIGQGVTLLEAQENSDVTYRVWDYDRLDSDGKPRQLHLERALDVLSFAKYCVPDPIRTTNVLHKCPYFTLRRITAPQVLGSDCSYTAVTSLSDTLKLGETTLNKGQTAFMSAGEKVSVNCGEMLTVTTEK